MFDRFCISSGNLFYTRLRRDEDDWLIEVGDQTNTRKGTSIIMEIRTDATWTTNSVFESFIGDSQRFRKTHVPIKLAQYPGEQLVSRSQAKRVLARFSNFSEVLLDFEDVDQIGQPFADEIFRVFKNEHSHISVVAINTNASIQKMINFVTEEQDQGLIL